MHLIFWILVFIMVTVHNISSSILEKFDYLSESENTKQWKILGQEKDGIIILGLHVESPESELCSTLLMYDQQNKNHKVLYTFDKYVNFIQASMNQNHTLLGFVTKEKILVRDDVDAESVLETVYKAYLVEIPDGRSSALPIDLEFEQTRKIALQFLYWKKEPHIIEKERFIVLIHKEGSYSQEW
ncbi:hypothetical protein J437_LFUL004693, partial [Ladona fulva]